MKRVITKIFAILTIGLMLINSSLVSVISVAIDSVEKAIDKTKINALYEMQLEKYVNYDINDTKGVMAQLNLKTGIEYQEGEEYKPLNSTEAKIDFPKINGELPEKVEVIAKSTKATNGDEKGKDFEYNYNNQTGELDIKIQNKADEKGNIYSENVENARDEMEIYAYYTENAYSDTNSKNNFNLSGKIKLNIANTEEVEIEKEIKENYEVTENISGLISTDIQTDDIYDGYIKANKQNKTQYETEYQENMKIQIGYENIADKVQIKTKNLLVNKTDKETETEDIVYTKTTVNKNEILDKLGEDGKLQILNNNGDILADINKDTEADENGNIEINYQNEEKELTIELSNPTKIGDINIKNSKKIKSSMVDTDINRIKEVDTITCTKEDDEETKEVYNFENSKIFEIKEATTDIELGVDNTEWTNNVQNDVTFTATFVSQNEKNALFENPTLEIKLPSEVEKVVLGDVSLLYSDELKIQNVNVVDKNGVKTIVIKTVGKQTTYNLDSLINGVNIVVEASVILEKNISTKNTRVEYTYKNDVQATNDYDIEAKECKNIDVIVKSNDGDIKKQDETQVFYNNEIQINAVVNENNLAINSYAQVANEKLQNGDIVKEGEVIKYWVEITNNSNKKISAINIVGQVPDSTNYATINRGSYYHEDYTYEENEEKRTVEFTNVEIKPNETQKYCYEVVTKTLNVDEKEIENNINIRVNDEIYEVKKLSNIIKKSKIKVELKSYIGRDYADSFYYAMHIYNLTNEDIENIHIETTELQKEMIYDISNIHIEASGEGTNVTRLQNQKYENRKISFDINTIKANLDVVVRFNMLTGKFDQDTNECELKLSAISTLNNGEKYRSNENIRTAYPQYVTIKATSEKEGETLKYGEEIEYNIEIKNESKTRTTVSIKDAIPDQLVGISAQYTHYIINNPQDVKTIYDIEAEKNLDCTVKDEKLDLTLKRENVDDIDFTQVIPAGKTIKIKILAKAGDVDKKTEISNYAIATGKYIQTKMSNVIKNYILPKDSSDTPESNPTPTPEPEPTPDPQPDPNPTPENETFNISGLAWGDENENGIRDENEKLLAGIVVKLFNIDTNSIVVTNDKKQIKNTDESGRYQFSKIPKGNYIVLFEYNTEKYKLTSYKNSEAAENENSDAINKTVNIDGVEKIVGVTDNINIIDTDYVNIDIGLISRKVIELKIDKYISKVTVSNSNGTKVYNYTNNKLAKIELAKNEVENTKIEIEYSIVVSNNGNTDVYINEIIDNKPKELKFIASDNENWDMLSNDILKNNELSGKDIKPNEKKEVRIVLIKDANSNYTGNIKNTAEISLVNKEITENENNIAEATFIISVKTGLAKNISIIAFIITFIIVLIYCIKKQKIKYFISIIMLVMLSINTVSKSGYYTNSEFELQGERTDMNIVGNGDEEEMFYDVVTEIPYHCEQPGYPQCSEDGAKHYYKLKDSDGKQNVDDASPGKVLKEINFSKENTNKSVKRLESNYNLVGPFKVKTNYGGNLKFIVKAKKTNNEESKEIDVGIVNKKGEDISKNVDDNSTNEFYIKISNEYNIITNVTAELSVEKVIMQTQKWQENLHYECVGTEGVHTYYYDENGRWDFSGDGSGYGHCYLYYDVQDMGRTDSGENTIYEGAKKTVSWDDDISTVGSIKITKKDSDNSNALTGAKFRVTGPNNYNQTFETNDKGEITISNIPIGKYTVTETGAPTGYNLDLQSGITQELTVEPAGTASHEFKNRQYGNLEIEKKDSSTNDTIKVAGFQFNIYKIVENTKYYLTSYTEGSPSTVTFSPWGNRYTLTTGSDGKTSMLKNIPIDTYYIEEIAIPESLKDYYNVTADNGKRNVKLVTNTERSITYQFFNQQIYTDVAGYVWEDITQTKADIRNNLYDENKDKLVSGITVRLKNSKDNSIVQTTTTGNNGQYRFKKVEIEQLSNYYIEFEYNGLKYEAVESNLSAQNGSKVKENNDSRTRFNKSYSTIVEGQDSSNGSTIGYSQDENGNESNRLNYTSSGNTSTLVQNTGYTVSSTAASVNPGYGSVGTTMISTTVETGMKLNWTAGSHEITNINLGIYERNQPDLAIATDISKIDMTINGYKHTYNLGQRNDYISEGIPDNELNNAYNSLMDGFQIAVKNRNGNYKNMTYTRGIDDAYIAYTKANPESEERLKVYVTYKISLKNESSVPYVKVKGLENYADSQLDCISSYIDNDTNNIVKWTDTGSTSDSKHKIWKSGEVNAYIESGKMVNVYLVYEVKKEAIISLANLNANGENAYILSNTTEITSYSSYDTNNQAYAGIDKDSAPGNIVYGDVSTYEDDTDSAPELKMTRKSPKEISGLVFEDATTLNNNKERLGDGRYDNGNNTIKNVQVKLRKYNTNDNTGITLYTLGNNGEVVTKTAEIKTDDKGKYDFIGIIPGEYYLEYTYGTDTGNITTQDYKSTIVTNEKLKQSLNNQSEYWYQDDNLSNYSSAVDDWNLRTKINQNLSNITYSSKTNYENKNDSAANHTMVANTGKMTFAIEETKDQTTNFDYQQPSHTYNIKFGVAERPKQYLDFAKEISYVKLTLPTGDVIVEGDPRTDTIRYVTYPRNGMVKIEMDEELIQGSKLEISYTISITNNSETDYNTEAYYKYGNINGAKAVETTINTVIDYVDDKLQSEYTNNANNGEWAKAGNEIKELLKDNVYNEIKTRTTTLTNNANLSLKVGETKDLKTVNVSKLLSSSEDTIYENYAEIIKVSNDVGKFYNGTPGNFLLTDKNKTHESDDNAKDSRAQITLVPSTGDNTIIYYIVGIVSLSIVAGGIVLIKKKIL